MVKGKASFYGGYSFRQRFVVITDPDLTKDILVKNFACFVDKQGDSSNNFMINNGTLAEEINMRQFVALKGEDWKDARSAFSPIFTSGKMKAMLPLIKNTSENLLKHIAIDTNKAVELKELFGKFSMDTIASCAFGVDAKSFDVVQSDFVSNAKNVFKFNAQDVLKILGLILIPGMARIFKWIK